ncbi:MAG: hypothetical protein HZB99_03850 [Candidatus Harrisonbacteria bacterium]|nr:hypothetical protein [Candidatus Harrisonbacteria bacterium]
MYLEANPPDYRKIVENLNKFADFARILIQKVNPPPLPEIERIDNYRKRHLEIFSKQTDFSSQIHQEGECSCCYQNYPPIKAHDIFYLLLKNPKFKFPEPDLEWLCTENTKESVANLEGKPRSKCVFLGPGGCRLKDDRPAICLAYIGCKGLTQSSRQLLSILAEEMVKELRGGMVSLVSDWWRKFLESITKSNCIEGPKSKYNFLLGDFNQRYRRQRFSKKHFSEYTERDLEVFWDVISSDDDWWRFVDKVMKLSV